MLYSISKEMKRYFFEIDQLQSRNVSLCVSENTVISVTSEAIANSYQSNYSFVKFFSNLSLNTKKKTYKRHKAKKNQITRTLHIPLTSP